MQSFYLHVRSPGAPVREREELVAADLQQALAQGQRNARTYVRSHAARPVRGSLDIEDQGGSALARILFADVMRQMS